jgi:NADH-quinone oxidoreductase subunit D/NADH-quinone oxidoreductase subunit C/D
MKPSKKIIIPEGVYYTQLETARGILGMVIVSDGISEKPARIHMRSPNFNNLWALDTMTRGARVGDLVANVSSLDIVVPDIDR